MSTHAGSSLDAGWTRAAAVFEERTGRDPDGTWAAPGRVNLIGEHTDYNDGFVLPIGIDRYAVVAIGVRADRRVRLWSLQEPDIYETSLDDVVPRAVRGWGAYPIGVAWALGREGPAVPGFDLVVDGSVPVASGLSSSAALGCAVATALSELSGAAMDPIRSAHVAHRAEVEGVGVPVGVMDQMAATLSRAGHALLLDTRTGSFEHVPFDPAKAGMSVIVIDTRVPRRLVDAAYADRRSECEEAVRILAVDALRDVSPEGLEDTRAALGPRLYRRARHVVRENQRVIELVHRLRSDDWRGVGSLLTASHSSLRDDYEVSSPELDAAVDAALAAGALGARLTGAGFGGSALALASSSDTTDIANAVTAAFTARRFERPSIFDVRPVDGAHRIR